MFRAQAFLIAVLSLPSFDRSFRRRRLRRVRARVHSPCRCLRPSAIGLGGESPIAGVHPRAAQDVQVPGHRRCVHGADSQGPHRDEEHPREVPRQKRKGRGHHRPFRYQVVSGPQVRGRKRWRIVRRAAAGAGPRAGRPAAHGRRLSGLARRRGGSSDRVGGRRQPLRQPASGRALVQGRHRREDQGADQRRHDRRQASGYRSGDQRERGA